MNPILKEIIRRTMPFIIVFLLLLPFVFFFSYRCYRNENILKDLIVNAYGTMFDVLIVGIVITIIDEVISRKRKIEQYIDQIEDLRYWHDMEAVFRIRANINRLQKLGYYALPLQYCFLKGIHLEEVNLSKADLSCTVLCNASFWGADLRKTQMCSADLKQADLKGADLAGADLAEASLCYADLSFSNLKCTNLDGADLSGANLNGADLTGANLNGANFSGVNLKNTLNDGPQQFSNTKGWNGTGTS
jgi:hypothetical protein